MKVTLLDTETGVTVEVDDNITAFQWAKGNWSCDCNRTNYFGRDVGDEVIEQRRQQLKKEYSHITEVELNYIAENTCYGAKRFLVIAPEIIEDSTGSYTLQEVNEDYPSELLKEYYGEGH